MTRRPTTPRIPTGRRRSVLVVIVVVVAVLAIALAMLPGALLPPAPLDCRYGEVILNGVHMCAPAPAAP